MTEPKLISTEYVEGTQDFNYTWCFDNYHHTGWQLSCYPPEEHYPYAISVTKCDCVLCNDVEVIKQ